MRTAIIAAAIIIVGHQDAFTTGETLALGLMLGWDLAEIIIKAVAFNIKLDLR